MNPGKLKGAPQKPAEKAPEANGQIDNADYVRANLDKLSVTDLKRYMETFERMRATLDNKQFAKYADVAEAVKKRIKQLEALGTLNAFAANMTPQTTAQVAAVSQDAEDSSDSQVSGELSVGAGNMGLRIGGKLEIPISVDPNGTFTIRGKVDNKTEMALAELGIDIDPQRRLVMRAGYERSDASGAALRRDALEIDRRALETSRVETLSAGLQLIQANGRGGAVAGWSAGAEVRGSRVNGGKSDRLYTEYVTNPDGSVDSRNYDLHGGVEARGTASIGFNVGDNGVLTLSGAAGQRYMNNGVKLDTASAGIRIDTPNLYAGVDVTMVGDLRGGKKDIPTQTQITGTAGYRFQETGVRLEADFKATHINGERGGKVAKEVVGSVVVPFNYTAPSEPDRGPDWKSLSQELSARNFMSMPTLALGTDPKASVRPAPEPVTPTATPTTTVSQKPGEQKPDTQKPDVDPKKPGEQKPEDPKKPKNPEGGKKEIAHTEQKNEFVLKKYVDPKTGVEVQESVVEQVTHYKDGTTQTKYVGYVQVADDKGHSFAKEYAPQWNPQAGSGKPESASAWISNPKALPNAEDLRKLSTQQYQPGAGWQFTPAKWQGGGTPDTKPSMPITQGKPTGQGDSNFGKGQSNYPTGQGDSNFGKGQSNYPTGQGDSNFGKGQSNYPTQVVDNGQQGKQSAKRK